MTCSAPAFVGGQIVHDDDVAGPEGWDELFDVGLEACALIGPSKTSGAVEAVERRPATKVVVFQWPVGDWKPATVAPSRSGRDASRQLVGLPGE